MLSGNIYGDASVAFGIIHRTGLGKTRHINTSYLWIQEVAAQRRLAFAKVLGKENPADLYTKCLDVSTVDKHTNQLKCKYTSGRSNAAPEVYTTSMSWTQLVQRQDSFGLFVLEQKSMEIMNTIQTRQSRVPGVNQPHLMSCTRQTLIKQNFIQDGVNVISKHINEVSVKRRSSPDGLHQAARDTKPKSNDIRTPRTFRVDANNSTDLGQPVLQGYKRQVQGYNGWNAAQLDRPWFDPNRSIWAQ